MLKSITPFLLGDQATARALHADKLEKRLPKATARDPEKTMWACAGFANCHSDFPVFVAADGTRMLTVQVRERVLPAKVIKTSLLKKADEIGERQGYYPGRKQMAELKELVTMELLPTSHIKPVDIPVMITKGYLLIGTTSARQVDIVLSLLFGLFDELENPPVFVSAGYKRDVSKFLMDLLLSESTDSCLFECEKSVTLKGDDKSVARFKDIPMSVEAINDRIRADMHPVELAINAEDRMLFSLTDKLLVKRIRFSDVILKEATDSAEDAAAHYESTVVLVAAELTAMLNNLLAEIPEIKDDSKVDEDDEL